MGRNLHELVGARGGGDRERDADSERRGAGTMVREFTDSRGRGWRAWDVTPDELSPRTKDEDYLAQLYYTGWIVFEAVDGEDKRRLYPVPKGWGELPVAELEVLLRKAEIVPKRKLDRKSVV